MKNSENPNSIRSVVLFVTTLGSFLTPFMASAVNIALPSIGTQFKLSAVVLSWVGTAYTLAAAVFLVPFGRLADIYGRKKIYLYGMIIFTAASLLSALATNPFFLILTRVVHGAGAAMLFATGIAMISSVFPSNERGKALGINVSMTYLGLTAGPVLGGLLVRYFGWRSIFLINVPLGIVVVVFILTLIKGEWVQSYGEHFDKGGSLLYGFGVTGLIYGLTKLTSESGIVLIIAGIAVLFLFIIFEQKTPFPVLHINLFRNNPVFLMSNIAAFINYSATFATGFLLSLYLQFVKGFPPDKAGMILIAQPVVMALFSTFAGKMSDRIEPRYVGSTGMALTATGLLFFTVIDSSTSMGHIIVGLLVMGMGLALFSSPNTNAIMGSVDHCHYGIASSMVGTMRLLGQMFSMGISMFIFSIIIGKAAIEPQNLTLFIKGAKLIFIIFEILCLFGIGASMARGKMRVNKNSAKSV
jgi:EmrB/QacA subfamily drug resistance transporter